MSAVVRTASLAHVIERDRLVELIDAARPVALLLAPAGCGKSTVIAQYLARCDGPYVRFDVRREHAGLLGFARGFAESVQTLAPGARTSVADAVASALSTPSPGAFLADWMNSHLRDFCGTIVLDDIHLAMEDDGCCDFLASLVRLTRLRVRWVLAGRGAGRLPLAEWQGEGLAALGPSEEDLRFTRPEVAAAFAEAELPANEIDTLLSRTSGWAVALSLALRLRERSPDLRAALASARELSHDFLADQIYASLTREERSLLAVAAFLPEIDTAVLEAAGFDDAAARLNELHRRHSILTPRDDGAVAGALTYRCHDLFRDYVVVQVALLGAAERKAIKLRAARALDVCGRSIAAFRLYAEAGETETTLRLIERDGFELVDRGHSDAFALAIQSLPAQHASHPAVLGTQGYLCYQQGRHDEAIAWLERAIAASRDDVYRARLVICCSFAMWARFGDPSPLLEPLVSDESLPAPLRAELTMMLAGTYQLFDPERDFGVLFDRSRTLAEEVASPVAQARIFCNLGRIAGLRGLASTARELLVRAAERAEAAGLHGEAADAYEGLAELLVREGEDAQGAQFADRSRDAAEKSGRLVELQRALHRQIAIFSSAGRREELDRALARCRDVVPPDASNFKLTLMSIEALSAGSDGDFAKAYAIQAPMAEAIPTPFWESRMLAHARCALFLAVLKRREEALQAVKCAIQEGQSIHRAVAQTRYARYIESASALCALACAIAADRETARRLLARTKHASTPAGKAMLTAVAAIVETAGASGDAVSAALARLDEVMLGGYARLFEAILAKVRGETEGRHGLTQSELEILRALAAGDAPKTIALERGCSVFTVRRHIRGVVEKLGCSGYRQAVKIARERGLA
jgi:DNA-binding CsgD family transcriptional regulator/tetratricopeptide (TPR) repeat protein